MKHTLRSITLILVLSLAAVAAARAADFDKYRLYAHSAIVLDTDTGKVLYEKDADKTIPPASLTKILTMFLAYEAMEQGKLRPWDRVAVSHKAADTGGSTMSLRHGERVTVNDLMHGMAIASGNDACIALAEHMAGSADGFVRQMNRKARSLGMTRTLFKNPNGLPAEHQLTTARDMLKLARAYLARFPQSLELHSQRSLEHNGYIHNNANRLLGEFPGADGLKTGYVTASGYNIIATAKRNGHRVIAVVLGSRSSAVRKRETAKLLETAFAEIGQPATMLAQATSCPPAKASALAKAAPAKNAAGERSPKARASRSVRAAKNSDRAQGSDGVVVAAAPAKETAPLVIPQKGRYTIQESSFKSREFAEARRQDLKREGLPARVVGTRSNSKSKWYRVLIGRFPSLQAAESVRQRLVNDHGLSHAVILQ